jgi:hypothetical protein
MDRVLSNKKLHNHLGRRFLHFVLITSLCLASSALPAKEPLVHSGTLEVTGWNVNLVIGANWGDGILRLNDGRRFRVSYSGLDLVGMGVKRKTINADVFNLDNLADFSGLYKGVDVTASMIKGISNTKGGKNENGVFLVLQAEDVKGGGFNVGPKGMSIVLEQELR